MLKNLFGKLFTKSVPTENENIKPQAASVLQNSLQQVRGKIPQRKKRLLFLIVVLILVIFILIKIVTFGLVQILLLPAISLKVLIGILVGFIALVLLYFYKPQIFTGIISSIRNKIPILHAHAQRHAETVQMHSTNWITKFKESPPSGRWVMVRKPLGILIALFLIIKFGYLFFPPNISTSFPGNKSVEAPLDSKIEVIFNKGVIKSSAEKTFNIIPDIKGTFSWEGDQKLIFTPKDTLKRGAQYTVSFKGFVFSKYLIPLIGNNTVTFDTVGNPKVILSSPTTEALEDLSPVTVVFDRAMIPLTTATNSAEKKPAFEITPEVPGKGRWLGTTAYQFRPDKRYKQANTYKVTVSKGIRSQDGGELQKDFSWEFSSQRPKVEAVSPAIDYSYASPTASVAAIFNQNMDPESLSKKFVLYDKNNNKIPGRVEVSGRIVGFYALSPLKREELYKAVIEKGANSVEGENGLEDSYSWSFKTAASPKIISTTPQNNTNDVKEQSSVQVSFKTPMDEDSFDGNVTIDPSPDLKPSVFFSSYDNKLSIGTYLGRSQNYKITISGNVKDQYGVALGNSYTFSFKTSPYKPSLSIYPSNTFFGAFNQQVVPRIVAQTVNTNKVTYTLYKLTRDDFLDLYRRRYDQGCTNYDQSCVNWQSYDPKKLQKVRTWSETFQADFNTPVQVVTKITLGNGSNIPPGLYFLDLRIPEGPHDNMVMIVSKNTLTVKKSDTQIFSWAVNQASANVSSGMNVELTNSSGTVLASGTTNKDGVFMKDVDLKGKNDLFIFGQKDDDIVVAASAWNQGINTYDFGLPSYYNPSESSDYYAKENYKIFVTQDRLIYRPGQKVYFKGVVRKDNDGAYEAVGINEKVSVQAKDAMGRIIYTKDLPISSFGSFFGDLDLSKNSNLGSYGLTATFHSNSYTQNFSVEEYKKPDLAMTIKSNKSDYIQGETADIGINSSFYFGAPVADMPVSWTLQTEDYSFRWDKDWRFEFGDPDSYWSRGWWYYQGPSYFSGKKVTEGRGVTNGKGDLELQLPLDISKQKTSQHMVFEANINDTASNQYVAAKQEFTVNKASIYAGLHPVSYSNQAGKEAQVEVVTVDLEGVEVPNTQVSLEFFKRKWDTVREQNPDDGLFYYTSKPNDTSVSKTSVTTDSLGHATGSFTPTEGGTYKVVATVTDKSGNQNVSGSFVWVSGFGFEAERSNNDRIILVTDKRDYSVGENMSIFVASPFASDSAKTLLTVERGNVLDYKIVDTNTDSNNFKMSVAGKYTPNAFVGAVLVKGGDQVKKPAEFKIGYTEVKVTDKKKQLKVVITSDKKRYKPKDTAKIQIETRDMTGAPVSTELAVGLIDKAVWDLSNQAFPDIYKTFYQPRSLGVATSQLLTISLDRIYANTNLGSKGGSGGGCFTGDTPVLMKGGIEKNIQDVKIGDVILTRESENSPKLVETKVLKTFKHENIDTYIILNGYLKVTPVHKMFVNREWITAGQIQTGDYVLDKSNVPVKIYSIERVYGNFTVYNLETETYHTYFAGNIYVHNQKGGDDTSRTKFPDTAYWNPNLKTDQNGKATIEVKLPDSLTTWRLSVVANSQGAAFGSNSSEFIVSRDVLIRPFLPRFLSVGDQSKLGAILVNTSGQDQKLIAKIETQGIKINDDSSKAETIPDGGQVRVTWNTLTLDGKSAKIKLTVSGEDGSAKDAIEINLPVKSYSVPEVVATAGQAKDVGNEKIVLPKELDTTQGQASLTLSPSLGSASFDAMSYLNEYPYFCTEQITSKFTPAVLIHRILVSAKIDHSGVANVKDLEETINDGIQRLNTQQHADGGWGWWVESDSDPFITAYAFQGLVEAKKDKFPVSDQTLGKAQEYLMNTLSYRSNGTSLGTQAFILYALKGRGLNLSSYESNLYQRRFELSLKARANLVIAMHDSGMNGQAKKLLQELISLSKKTATTTHWEEPKNTYYFMGDNTTLTATVLEALSIMDSRNPLIPEVVRFLMTTRYDGHWSSTLDTAAVIKSVSFMLLKNNDQHVDENYKVTLNGKNILQGKFTKDDLLTLVAKTMPVSQFKIGGSNSLQISKSGQGNLYYNINLKYYLPFSEIDPLEQGMVVERELVDGDGNPLSKTSITQNSEAWVRLTVVAPEERHFVAIEDILPAGLESVNESLKNVTTLSAKAPKSKNTGSYFYYFNHKEYHDDRTTLFADYLPAGVYEVLYRVRATVPGLYHYPPASAYQMYTPDVSGHSDGGWFEVKE